MKKRAVLRLRRYPHPRLLQDPILLRWMTRWLERVLTRGVSHTLWERQLITLNLKSSALKDFELFSICSSIGSSCNCNCSNSLHQKDNVRQLTPYLLIIEAFHLEQIMRLDMGPMKLLTASAFRGQSTFLGLFWLTNENKFFKASKAILFVSLALERSASCNWNIIQWFHRKFQATNRLWLQQSGEAVHCLQTMCGHLIKNMYNPGLASPG